MAARLKRQISLSGDLRQRLSRGENPGAIAARNRGLFLVAALVTAMIAVSIYIAVSLLNSRMDDLRRDVERDLLTLAQERASSFTLWYGTITTRVQSVAEMDLLRLLAVEVRASSLSAEDEEIQASLKSIRKVLFDVINQSNLQTATLLDADMVPYVTTADALPELSESQKAALMAARETGLPQTLPAHVEQRSGFAFTFIQPIFPPAYVVTTGTHPAGFLLIVCDMTDMVVRLSDPGQQDTTIIPHLLQAVDGRLSAFVPATEDRPAEIVPWPGTPAASTTFTSLERTDGTRMYTLTIQIPMTPWFMECDIVRSEALEAYRVYRVQVILSVAGCLGVVLFSLGIIWWLLVGQRERAVAAELHNLYATVNAQSQLLDNVNSAVNDGIVLTDTGNTIHYVNQSFSRMVGVDRSQLVGQTFARALSTHTNLPINPHVASVLREGASRTYREELERENVRSTYQVVCSPYRNARGAVEGVVSVYRDITSSLEAERHNEEITNRMIQVLVRGIEVFDPYLGGQTMFTATLAQTLGHHMCLDERHLTTLRIAALLSKVGMIKVPTAIRTKETAFTPEERKELERHVEYTRELLAGIDFGVPVQQALYQMYECMNGTGYPAKIRGEAIMLDARILAVANTFCAVMRPRAYRQARSLDETLDILTSPCYDPQVVNVLRAYIYSSDGAAFAEQLKQP